MSRLIFHYYSWKLAGERSTKSLQLRIIYTWWFGVQYTKTRHGWCYDSSITEGRSHTTSWVQHAREITREALMQRRCALVVHVMWFCQGVVRRPQGASKLEPARTILLRGRLFGVCQSPSLVTCEIFKLTIEVIYDRWGHLIEELSNNTPSINRWTRSSLQ